MKRYAYFPGCSLHSTGVEYRLSTLAVFERLSLPLVELKGWNCCGASSAHALDAALGVALPARNLALAQQTGLELVASCAACFNRLQSAKAALLSDADLRRRVEGLLGMPCDGQVVVRPALAILYEDYGVARLAAQVSRPLRGLKVAPYYGCLLVRPPEVTQFDDPDQPLVMGALLEAVGAEARHWSHATDCCGGSLSLSRADLTTRLVSRLADRAREAGADAIVTACPLCQVNLEMRQPGGKAADSQLPVFYFTELLGLALELPEAPRWWRKHLIDPRPLLRRAGLA